MSPQIGAGVLDAHLHLSRWWPDIGRTGYASGLDYSVHGLLSEMDRAGVSHAVAIQLFLAPSEVEALDEGRSNFEASGGRLLPVASFDPTQSEETRCAVLERLERERSLYGIKLFPGYRPFYPHDPRLEPVYELAHRRQLPVLIHQGDTLDGMGLLKFARPIEVDEVAARYRDVRFVLCHLGNPWIDEATEILYKNSNVFADTSGLLPAPSSPYFEKAFENCRKRVEEAVVASGAPGRLLYGSDWPLEDLRVAVRLIDQLDIDREDRRGILGENARRLFRIER